MIIKIASRHKANPEWSLWRRFQANFVKMWTSGDYFHTEIIVEDKWISAHIKDGVKILDLKELNHKYWHYKELEVDKKYLADAWLFIRAQEGKAYDKLGILFAQGFKMDIHNPKKWFCNELGMAIVQKFHREETKGLKPHEYNPSSFIRLFK